MERKKYFISADIEGITDVTAWSETEKGQDGYEKACYQMSMETAAACRAVLDAGYDVVVRDGHGTARNMDHSLLPKGSFLMRGWAQDAGSMLAGLDETYAGVIFIGYHAPAGTKGSPLAHTIDKDAIREVRINGKLASEFTMNRLYAAGKGVPSVFISGDEMICQMAAEEVPGIHCVAVKKCKGNSTFNMHPQDACDKIYEEVTKAVSQEYRKPDRENTYVVEVILGMPKKQNAVLRYQGVKQIAEDAIAYTAESAEEINLLMDQVLDIE